MKAPPTYDAVVVGGGPAGAATALALRRAGVARVLLLESQDYASVRIGESIPPETRLLLEGLGIWDEFLGQGHDPAYGSCSAWGSDELGHKDYVWSPHGHGWHLDRRRFDELLARAAENAGAELRLRTRCLRITPHATTAGASELLLQGADGVRRARARFVIDAAGRGSGLARRLGAHRRAHDRFAYVTAFFEGGDEPSRLTWIEAVEYGWWYAARLPQGRIVVALATDAETVNEKELIQPSVFRAHAARTRHLSRLLEGRRLAVGLHVRGARSCVLDRVAGGAWLAVGDAAASYDPIASQGIYKALREADLAARAVVDALQGKRGAIEAYGAEVRTCFNEYLEVRNHFYDLERRWSDRRFWRRRQSRRAPLPADGAGHRHL